MIKTAASKPTPSLVQPALGSPRPSPLVCVAALATTWGHVPTVIESCRSYPGSRAWRGGVGVGEEEGHKEHASVKNL